MGSAIRPFIVSATNRLNTALTIVNNLKEEE
jgi:hypothetical protein